MPTDDLSSDLAVIEKTIEINGAEGMEVVEASTPGKVQIPKRTRMSEENTNTTKILAAPKGADRTQCKFLDITAVASNGLRRSGLC